MMAETLKNLAQASPSAFVLTDFYTVPLAKSAVLSTFAVCNRGSELIRFRFAHAVAGEADADKQYIYYDEPIPPHKTFVGTLGITLAASDVLRIYADSNEASFGAWGSEVS